MEVNQRWTERRNRERNREREREREGERDGQTKEREPVASFCISLSFLPPSTIFFPPIPPLFLFPFLPLPNHLSLSLSLSNDCLKTPLRGPTGISRRRSDCFVALYHFLSFFRSRDRSRSLKSFLYSDDSRRVFVRDDSSSNIRSNDR